MEIALLVFACVLGVATVFMVWRLLDKLFDLRAEVAENYAVMCAYLAEDFGEEDEEEPDGVAVAGGSDGAIYADSGDYAYTPVPLYDGQGWYTPRSHAALRMEQGGNHDCHQ